MVFTSLAFLIFFTVVCLLYWGLSASRKAQNMLLLLSSYAFYGTAALPRTRVPQLLLSMRFEEAFQHLSEVIQQNVSPVVKLLFLLWFSSSFGYMMARAIQGQPSLRTRKFLMTISVLVHIGILCYFKYMNFFIQSFVDLADAAGWAIYFRPEHIVLPLAISFFTFHILGYTFDVYQKAYPASREYLDFITHIAFFPQLVAGPIERAGHLLPQFLQKRQFSWDKMEDGLRQVLWGFFKKLVIADSAARYVNYVFANTADQGGSDIALAGIMFTIQMYCDFSGYSDIAIGAGRLLGFELLKNFSYPFFSTSMTDFWRKWHISLTSWITDYLYTPISFQKRAWGKWGIVYAAIISFTLSGLWHGAAWPAILWGLLHGLALGYEVLSKKTRKKWSKKFNPFLYSLFSGIAVCMFWAFGQLIFRASGLVQIGELLDKLTSLSLFSLPDYSTRDIHFTTFFHALTSGEGVNAIIDGFLNLIITPFVKEPLYTFAVLMIIEWVQRRREYGLDIGNLNYMFRWLIYLMFIVLIFSSDNLNNQNEFIYFQF